MALLNNCDNILYAVLPACLERFTVKLPGLVPNAVYSYIITDKFDHVYMEQVTTDADGAFIIEASDFPEGYFNQYMGMVELEVKSNIYYCAPESFQVCGKEYNRILIDFKVGAYPAQIPCEC